MKDLIDLGNLVFDQLMSNHGELKESRLLFLYGITTVTKWSVINSNKWLLIERGGITKNFTDPVLDKLNEEWLSIKREIDYNRINRALNKMRAEFDRKAPRDGDVWEFGGASGTFRNISL